MVDVIPVRRLLLIFLLTGGYIAAADEAQKNTEATGPTASADWYCVGHDAAHTYTSADRLPPPLKLCWSSPAPEGELRQVASSNGKVFVHGFTTYKHGRVGPYDYLLHVETGMPVEADPGKKPDPWRPDLTFGYAIGTYNGRPYQCDDGGSYLAGSTDVWGSVALSPEQGYWGFVQHLKVDGPNPGVYCQKLDQPAQHSGWSHIFKVDHKDENIYCDGEVAIGPGALYAVTQWKVAGPDLVNGLACYELAEGKLRWHLDGKFICVSAGIDFCAAVDQRNALVVVAAADGKMIGSIGIPAPPECPPMVLGDQIRIYDEQGNLTSYQLVEKDGKRSLRGAGPAIALGKFEGPRILGRYNSAFCYSADGSLYAANGSSVVGFPSDKNGKRWVWTVPASMAQGYNGLGHPIIARGKLIVVGKHGLVCFDTEGAKPKDGDAKAKEQGKK